jgi:hypothetical protein
VRDEWGGGGGGGVAARVERSRRRGGGGSWAGRELEPAHRRSVELALQLGLEELSLAQMMAQRHHPEEEEGGGRELGGGGDGRLSAPSSSSSSRWWSLLRPAVGSLAEAAALVHGARSRRAGRALGLYAHACEREAAAAAAAGGGGGGWAEAIQAQVVLAAAAGHGGGTHAPRAGQEEEEVWASVARREARFDLVRHGSASCCQTPHSFPWTCRHRPLRSRSGECGRHGGWAVR